MTTPTPSPEAEALPTLPVVAWRARYISEPGMIGHYPWTFQGRERVRQAPGYEYESLTPHAPAEAAIVALRAEVAALRKERDSAMADAGRFRFILNTPNSALTTETQDFMWRNTMTPDEARAAIDARASLLGDGGTL